MELNTKQKIQEIYANFIIKIDNLFNRRKELFKCFSGGYFIVCKSNFSKRKKQYTLLFKKRK